MTEAKDSSEGEVTTENILRIADELVHQVDRTKKLVIVMIAAVIIGLPLSWHITPFLFGTPYDFTVAGIVAIIVAAIFLVLGVRQWMVFSKWTERYKAYKELQEELDAKLNFEGDAKGKASKGEQSSN